jgi:hypothetical protein
VAFYIALVVTHEDNPTETIWFESVAALCQEHGIESITPADPKSADLAQRIAAIAPDFIFSFYYRHMLPTDLLALAKRSAYNLHGSLLPKYRGRVRLTGQFCTAKRKRAPPCMKWRPNRMLAKLLPKQPCLFCRTTLPMKCSED